MKAFANFKDQLKTKYGSSGPAQSVAPNDAPLLPVDVERSTADGRATPIGVPPPPPTPPPGPPAPASRSPLPTGPPPPTPQSAAPAAPPHVQPQQAPRVDTNQLAQGARIWHLNYYKRFFDVETSDVRSRLLQAINPLRFRFLERPEGGPRADLYGPFWVSATLVFLLAAVSNVNRWATWDPLNGSWEYDLSPLPIAGSILAGYVTLLPFALFILCKWFSAPLGLVDLISLFGYSMTAYTIGVVLCLIPAPWAKWAALGVSAAVSGAFLIGHLFKMLLGLAISKHGGLTVLALALVFHTGFFLCARLYFLA